MLSGWSCAVGGVSLSEGGLPHGLQEAVGGIRWSQTSLRPGQPGFCCGSAAMGHCPVGDHRCNHKNIQ